MIGIGDAQSPLSCVQARLDEGTRQRRALLRSAAIRTGQRIAAGEPGPFYLDSHGWDTHAAQGSSEGRFASAAAGLDEAIAAIAAEAGKVWHRTIILAATEFGRSIAINQAGGTDHGIASAAFLVGGAVAGGRVLGAWPGLTSGPDLAPAVDLRAVALAITRDHLGVDPGGVDTTRLDPVPDLIRA
jgi:uncharacterized protein (DUF1501 family)